MRRERQALTCQDRVGPESLVEGLEVEAQDGDHEGIYFSGRVEGIDRSASSSDQWLVTVRFTTWGDTYTVPLSELRPKGWSDRQKLEPQTAKRLRKRPESSQASAYSDPGSSDSETDNRTTEQPARRRRTQDNGDVGITRITGQRIVGGKCEYLCELASGKLEWLARDTLEETDSRGLTTTTGALLAYEWAPMYVVQTYNNGQEYLVRFVDRSENDWARVPAAAFSEKDLQIMRANRPCVPGLFKQNALFRFFMGVQHCLRSPSDRSKVMEHFSAVEIEAVLLGLGTPAAELRPPAHAGDRVWLSLSREELDPLFRTYREEWYELRSSRGKLYGRIDFSEGKGVHVIWYARPSTVDFYTAGDRPYWTPLRHPAPYIEYVRVRVFAAESTEEEDIEAIA